MDRDPETFAAWRRRTAPQWSTSARVWGVVVLVVSLGVAVLSASGQVGWAIVMALVVAAAVWVSERVTRHR